ncbi:phage virion morphogenesis protein [Pseudomonas coleopterorum]|jgi:phage virion morphogenesis protein|uniref:phage virion morphogenesis protein n=1 Tax=Pseudomonas coleopterorum TaxID=1605838 RepID=UPI002A6999B1|nr:phage virion morphogenesis protein [Pseudomonas coleopterorum]MDY1015607.1 phage virion morphogenesis protein [Pseudomonas coleopterorum]
MSDGLEVLEEWAGALLAKLEPGERRKLLGTMVRNLRGDQQKRIALQRSPDGKPYEPRKRQHLQAKKGRIKGQMFRKLRGVRYMRTEHSVNGISLGFVGRAARIARVHHYGLVDDMNKAQAPIRYPERKVLGFGSSELNHIRDMLISRLSALSAS